MTRLSLKHVTMWSNQPIIDCSMHYEKATPSSNSMISTYIIKSKYDLIWAIMLPPPSPSGHPPPHQENKAGSRECVLCHAFYIGDHMTTKQLTNGWLLHGQVIWDSMHYEKATLNSVIIWFDFLSSQTKYKSKNLYWIPFPFPPI